MAKKTMNDVAAAGDTFVSLSEFSEFYNINPEGKNEYVSYEDAMNLLRSDQRLASRLLSYEGSLVVTERDVDNSNFWGRYLMRLRDAYLDELRSNPPMEQSPGDSRQVTVDWRPYASKSEDEEEELSIPWESGIQRIERETGERFIHVDRGLYKPRRRNVSRNGTTGLAETDASPDVPWQTFVCPFGTGSGARIRVGSAAEASFLYERALRGELDWDALVKDLTDRGLVKRGSGIENDVRDFFVPQFSWMREEICRRGDALSSMRIVTDTLLVGDHSLGASVYDYDTAPSPAHVIQRYVSNPLLFFYPAQNMTLRALASPKRENVHITVEGNAPVNGQPRILTIAIDGSQCIGGRVPGTQNRRYVDNSNTTYKYNADGTPVLDGKGRKVRVYGQKSSHIQFKPTAESDADYAAFTQRMDDILSQVPEGVSVRFLTGMDIGTQALAARYVRDKGGRVWNWNPNNGILSDESGTGFNIRSRNDDATKKDALNTWSQTPIGLVRMRDFRSLLPALSGLEPLPSDPDLWNDPVTGVVPDAAVVFSYENDWSDTRLLGADSALVAGNLPLIRVFDDSSVEKQDADLKLAAQDSLDTLTGGRGAWNESLFVGDIRKQWDLQGDDVSVLSDIGASVPLSIPLVARKSPGLQVFAGGIPFSSVYGAYAAFLAGEVYRDDPAAAAQTISTLSHDDGNFAAVSDMLIRLRSNTNYSVGLEEGCIRRAVHAAVFQGGAFADALLATGENTIVIPAVVNGRTDSVLFVDGNGNGENRFGVVLEAERGDYLESLRARIRSEAEAERRAVEAELRSTRNTDRMKARLEKYAVGLPTTFDEVEQAVWLLGTHRPLEITIAPDQPQSVVRWTMDRGELLTRDIARSETLDAGSDNPRVPNTLVFLYPSSRRMLSGMASVPTDPASRELYGVTRTDPDTGEQFVCAFGIPVKKNSGSVELGSMESQLGLQFQTLDDRLADKTMNEYSSFLTDHDKENLINGIILADGSARMTALQHGMQLAYAVRDDFQFRRQREGLGIKRGDIDDDLSRVFLGRVWSKTLVRKDKDGKPVLDANGNEMTEAGWTDTAHKAPALRTVMRKYESILDAGSDLPLTCIPLPKTNYSEDSKIGKAEFMSDFSLALRLANNAAVRMGRPLRVPYTEDGELDLGPDVPEEYRLAAEAKLDAFFNLNRQEAAEVNISDELPQQISTKEAFTRKGKEMGHDKVELYFRPSELAGAFGGFNFVNSELKGLAGVNYPLHEMCFSTEDGNVWYLMSGKNAGKMTFQDRDKWEKFERDDQVRFSLYGSDSSKLDAMAESIKKWVRAASELKIETRLLTEKESEGMDLNFDGFVSLLPSNSERSAVEEGEFSAREENLVEMKGKNSRNFNGEEEDHPYYGHVDAADGFNGYAQYRYTLPDGKVSDWCTISDREMALDVIYSQIMRVYKSDQRRCASRAALDAEVRSLAVRKEWGKFVREQEKPKEEKINKPVRFAKRNVGNSVSAEETGKSEVVKIAGDSAERAKGLSPKH